MPTRPLLPILFALLVLGACGQHRQEPSRETAPPADRPAADEQGFDRRFGAFQVQQSKLLPQLMQAEQLSAEARSRVQRQTAEVLEGLRQLAAEPELSRAERQRTRTEIVNLERMLEMYLPAG